MSTEDLAQMLRQSGEDIGVSSPPYTEIESRSRLLDRRRRAREVLVGGIMVFVVVIGGGLLVESRIASDDESTAILDSAPPTYRIDVRTIMEESDVIYVEGALGEVDVSSQDSPEEVIIDPYPEPVPWARSWTDLKAGSYLIEAALRPCGGNCGFLDPPTDSCQAQVALTQDTALEVRFHYGQPCTISVAEG
jgi:hypothetical protein